MQHWFWRQSNATLKIRRHKSKPVSRHAIFGQQAKHIGAKGCGCTLDSEILQSKTSRTEASRSTSPFQRLGIRIITPSIGVWASFALSPSPMRPSTMVNCSGQSSPATKPPPMLGQIPRIDQKANEA